MASTMPLLENNFRVYIDGDYQGGIAEGEFPTLEFMTSEIKGSGLAGTINMPAPGHFGSIPITLTWRTLADNYMVLGENRGHELDMYSEHLDWDSGASDYVSRQVHIYVKALTTKMDLGKMVVGESADVTSEHEAFYVKVEIDKKEMLEIDKTNYIYKVQGVDYLTDTRRALGMM